MIVQYQIAIKLNFCYIKSGFYHFKYEGLQPSARYEPLRSLAKKKSKIGASLLDAKN